MSATRQLVRWCLGKACGLRAGAAVTDPPVAIEAVRRAHTYARFRRGDEASSLVIGDVCVTAYRHAKVPERLGNRVARYPAGGFAISQALGGVGGIAGVEGMCGACPANIEPGQLAGCVGTLYQDPESESTQHQIEAIVARLGIADAVRRAFLSTEPIWYGLWAKSPLSREAMSLLRAILGAMHDEDAADRSAHEAEVQRHLHLLRAFMRAASVAETEDIPLHVALTPPGHVDFGYRTVFHHCPVCRAWQRHGEARCRVCGAAGAAVNTGSMEPMELEPELRQVLGDRFPAFAKAFLMCQGFDERDADDIVAATEPP